VQIGVTDVSLFSAPATEIEVRMSRLIASKLLVAALIVLPALSVHAQGVEPGDEWKITTSMKMEGFSMPGQTSTQCIAKSQTAVAPSPQDKNCKSNIVSQTGNTVEMTMACTGKDAMQGTGKFTTTGDSMSGQMQMTSSAGSMQMVYSGTRTGKACDAKALDKQVAAVMAQGTAAKEKMCGDAARDLTPELVFGKGAVCAEPKYRTAFCGNVKGEAAYTKLHGYETGRTVGIQGQPSVVPEIEGACGFKMVTMGEQLCAGAEQRKSWTFLAGSCPVQAQTIAKRECAGRSFTARTANPSPYDAFCSAYAANSPDKTAAAPDEKPAAETTTDKLKGGTKKLKGLLGF
jgi:hypothetical protein